MSELWLQMLTEFKRDLMLTVLGSFPRDQLTWGRKLLHLCAFLTTVVLKVLSQDPQESVAHS